jgi:SWIM/SEC-C metal-binding protein
MQKLFDGKKTAKLGTEANPAVLNVQTEKRAKALKTVLEENGWSHTISVDSEKLEDITDLDILLNPLKTRIAEKTAGRNDPCPCGSGKKYKKCCGQ